MKVSVGGRWCRTSCQNKQKTNKHTTTFPFRKLLLDITTHSVLLLQSLQFQCCVVVARCAFDSKHLSASQCWLFDLACCASVHKAEQRLCFFSFFEIFKDDQSADVLSHVGLLLWFYIGSTGSKLNLMYVSFVWLTKARLKFLSEYKKMCSLLIPHRTSVSEVSLKSSCG